MKEVIVRFLSGVLYISIILFSLFMSREWYIGLLFILAVITLNEFLKLVSLKGIIAYIILAISFYFLSYKEINSSIILILLSVTILVNLFLIRDILVLNKTSLFKSKRYFCIIFYIISGFVFLSLIPLFSTILAIIFFNEKFKGFHFYDMNICMEAKINGLKNYVTDKITLEHLSEGFQSKDWIKNGIKMHNHYKNELPIHIDKNIKKIDIEKIAIINLFKKAIYLKEPFLVIPYFLDLVFYFRKDNKRLIFNYLRSIVTVCIK